jgi:hypothetical protein
MNLHLPSIIIDFHHRGHHQHRHHHHHNHEEETKIKIIIDEQNMRRKMLYDFDVPLQHLFLEMIRQHRGILLDLIERRISSNEFRYYDSKNSRLIDDSHGVQGRFKRTIQQENKVKKRGTTIKIQNNNKTKNNKNDSEPPSKLTTLQKEIQREMRYLVNDVYKFKQTYYRQQEQAHNDDDYDDGKKETIESMLLYQMTIAERSLMYKDIFQKIKMEQQQQQQQQSLGNKTDSINVDDDDDGCAICLEDMSTIKTTTIVVRSHQCKHKFCEDCIIDYFSKKQRHLRVDPTEPINPCPICRREYCTIIIDNDDVDDDEVER